MSPNFLVTTDINMVSTTQIVVLCAIVGLNSAHVIFNHHRHRFEDNLGDMPQLLEDMFHPRIPLHGFFQTQPIDNPGILGFQSFGGQGLGDFSSGMYGQGQGGYGTIQMPGTSEFEREDGNYQGSVDDVGEQEKDPPRGTETPQDQLGDEFNNKNKETEPNKQDDMDNSNKDQETEKTNSVEKDGDDQKDQKAVDQETDSASNSVKHQSEDGSVSKQRDRDSIIFPDNIDQAKDQIAKESSYYINPQQSNGYVSSPGPQIIYAATYVPSGSSTSQVPYVSNIAQSNSQSQPRLSTVQSYPSTNNINVQNPRPQYQTNGNSPTGNVVSNNPTTNPGYTLVPLPNNGGNNPVYYTNNAPVSNPSQNTIYQPYTSGQQYYLVSMNGQNVLVPVNSVQTVPNQPNINKQTNLIPINQGSYVPSNNQVYYVPSNSQANYVPSNSQASYVPINNPNASPSTPQNNGQVQYIAVQLAPQNNPQNNNQPIYVPANQGIVQIPGQNTAQGSVNYVPVTSQPTLQTLPQNNNQVTYVSRNPAQVVQVQPQNQPQSNNQIRYVPANPQTVVQVGSNIPTNSGQTTYVPWNPQKPQSTTQYKLVPLDTQNNVQGNSIRLVPATLTSNGNVSLLSFKEKEKVSPKDEIKHKESNNTTETSI